MKRSTLWPLGITAILAITVGANFWLLRVANDDPSFAIEPNYYQKAVNWDSTMAQERRNAALGWKLAPSLGAFSTANGALLHVSLADSAGRGIAGAHVTVSALFNARANDIYSATLVPDSAGYHATLPVRHAGEWELRFDVRRDGAHFTSVSRVDAEPAAGS
ncbi:MAG TPA: FixH family protein [Gemmatimonadaceae bacterium]|nr:FixH family protein [Gemmatimonadaceae bacterium]